MVSHPVARAAQQRGIEACLPTIANVSTFLSKGAPTGAHVFVDSEQKGEQLFSVSLEADHPGATVYSSASFAPVDAGCSGSYDIVRYVEASCEAVAGKYFPKDQSAGRIRDNITVYKLGPTARAFLLPAGSGCLTIRKVTFRGVQPAQARGE